jgi:hypothetical protein
MTTRRFHLQFNFYSLISFTTVVGACSGFVLIPFFTYHNITNYPSGNLALLLVFVFLAGHWSVH